MGYVGFENAAGMTSPLLVTAASGLVVALAGAALTLPLAPSGTPASPPLETVSMRTATDPGWVFPLPGSAESQTVLAPFDPPEQPWLAGHRGVDLAAAVGAPVLSPAAGVVKLAGTVVDRGVVVVLHDDGLRSSFEPVTPGVSPGTRVAQGEAVGVVAETPGHCDPEACLHWGVRRGETYLDPLSLLGDRPPIVLLPLA